LKVLSLKLSSEELNRDRIAYIINTVTADNELVVFPQYVGQLFRRDLMPVESSLDYLDFMKSVSEKYSETIFCPGGMAERENDEIYQFSVLLKGGHEILRQRQLYLSRREAEGGIRRGKTQNYIDYKGFKIAIILGTDVFYPQVSRRAARSGVNLALFPVALEKSGGLPLQLSGVWREVESNQFFAVESPLCGEYQGVLFDGKPIIHGPLEMTPNSDGFIDQGLGQKAGASGFLDNECRLKSISGYNVLSQLNPQLYKDMHMFGGN